jgi:hypothetical protein
MQPFNWLVILIVSLGVVARLCRDFVLSVRRFARGLDKSHPFPDTIWAILTGYVDVDTR